MKKLLISFLLLFCALVVNATIITVDNNPNSAADYTDLQAAIDAANPGDTIYISGSTVTYGTGTINILKPIVLIGSGINDEDPSENTTRLVSITFTDPAASGTVILNLSFGGISISGVDDVTDIIIRRCKLNTSSSISIKSGSINWLIENNIFQNSTGISLQGSSPVPTDIIIRNNIFSNFATVGNFTHPTTLIHNNLFLGTSIFSPLHGLVNVQIKNNIFYFLSSVTGGSGILNVIRNNLSNVANGNYGGPGDDGTNITADPLFTNGDGTFSFASDYRLQPGSPALTASASGGEIGIFGGVAPFPIDIASSFLSNPGHVLPVITDMEILSSDVPLDGTVEVQVKARISN